jgi:uncharacterized protein (TIGR03437 family)
VEDFGGVNQPESLSQARIEGARTSPTLSTRSGFAGTTVTYAGAAPTLIGICQVNVQIPANASKGAAAALVLNAGGNVSQDGVTIAIQ